MIDNEKHIKIYAKLEETLGVSDFNYIKLINDYKTEDDKTTIDKEYVIYINYQHRFDENIDKKDLIEYVKKRITHTSNIFLLSRYNHFLYNSTLRQEYCQAAINMYILILHTIIKQNLESIYHDILDVLNYIINLGKTIKADLTTIKESIISYLKTDNISRIIQFHILMSIKDNYKKWKFHDIDFIPQLCLNMYNSFTYYNDKKLILELGVFFAIRTNRTLLSVLYEKLGDNEETNIYKTDGKIENIIIPHHNQNIYYNMMLYYDLANNKEKYHYASTKYNNNKPNLQFISFKTQLKTDKERYSAINQIIESLLQENIILSIFFLSKHNSLLYPPHQILDFNKLTKGEKYYHMELLTPTEVDLNGNIRYSTNEEHYLFQFYQILLNKTIDVISYMLFRLINTNKLTYSILKEILLSFTNFGDEIQRSINNSSLSYKFFDKIDFALKDFFTQFHKEMNNKPSDWRLVITTLTIQFEGILRDYIRIECGETSKIVNNNKGGNVSEMLLDDLLRADSFNQLFCEEDQDLFKYVFTNKGLNMRNDIAHGFYLPQDYTYFKAILAFLCILRLVKFK